MGEGASTWVVEVKVWYCDGWLANNPKKERKKQLVRCAVKQTKERKETSNNNLRFATCLKEKNEEELASQQICSEEINSGKQRQGSEKIWQQNCYPNINLRGGDLGWGKLFRFKCGIKNYFQLAKTNLRTQFNCNKIW